MKSSIQILIVICGFLLTTDCVYALPDDPELKQLGYEDQKKREGVKFERTDQERLTRVLELIGEGRVRTANDYLNAGYVLQHTGLTECDGKFVSISPHNYFLAHQFFKKSFELGNKEARYLIAASIDRYLSFTQGYQLYGTNQVYNLKTERMELLPIDRSITDKERAKYGVAPLEEILKRAPEGKRNQK